MFFFMFKPHLDTFIGAWGVPYQYKNKSWHKTIFWGHFAAIFLRIWDTLYGQLCLSFDDCIWLYAPGCLEACVNCVLKFQQLYNYIRQGRRGLCQGVLMGLENLSLPEWFYLPFLEYKFSC